MSEKHDIEVRLLSLALTFVHGKLTTFRYPFTSSVHAPKKNKNLKDVEFLGALVFGKKSAVENITKKFKLYTKSN